MKTNDEKLAAVVAKMKPLEEQAEEKRQELDALFKKLEPLRKRRDRLQELVTFPTDDDITWEKIFALDWHRQEGAYYNRITKWIGQQNLRYMYQSGYILPTDQISMKIKFHRDEPFEPQYEEFMLIEPYVKSFAFGEKEYRKPKIGEAKYFSIFEHSLSEYRVYSFHVLSDRSSAVWDGYETKRFPDIETGLRYVQQNHWYACNEEDDD